MARKVTNELYELAEQGVISWETLATACMKYMSEDDVADMAHCNEFIIEEDEEEENEDD
jgi:hypothetical protein